MNPADGAISNVLTVRDYAIDTRVCLGFGYRCQVYIATHTPTSTKVAARVCIVPAPTERDPCSLRAMALGEIEIMRMLGGHHPNIAHLIDSVVEDTRIVTFIELSPHGDLLEWLKRNRRVSEPQGRRLMRQLLSAVAFTHAANVAHRDIKLENVLLLTDDSVQADNSSGFERVALRVTLIDWNLSTRFPLYLTQSAGSPAYAAPELLVAYPSYSALVSDVWSLGVLAYSLLVGGQPFNSATSSVNETFDNISNKAPIMPAHLSLPARGLLTEMLCKDPRRRPTAVQLQKHAWTLEDAADPIYAHS